MAPTAGAQAACRPPGPGRARGPALARGPGGRAGGPRQRPAPLAHLARGDRALLPDLKALYAAEPDGLFWFAGDSGRTRPSPGRSRRSPSCDADGPRPRRLRRRGRSPTKWEALRSGAGLLRRPRALRRQPSPSPRCGSSQSLPRGRVDPVSSASTTTSAPSGSTWPPRSVPRATRRPPRRHAAAEPQFPVYRRLVKALAYYRRSSLTAGPTGPPLAARQK